MPLGCLERWFADSAFCRLSPKGLPTFLEHCLYLQTAYSSIPAPEGLPTFLVFLREIFFNLSPHPTLIENWGCGGQLHLQSSTCLALLSSDQRVAGSPTQFTRPWVRGLQGAPAGRNCLPVTKVLPLEKMPKNCQVTDSPLESLWPIQTKLEFGGCAL